MTPWTAIDATREGAYRVFDVWRRHMRSPDSGRTFDFYVIDAPDWVNVIPVTPDRQVVCVRQYRAGTDAVTLEVPGGMIDDADDDAVAAARREMREETGYVADRCVDLGAVAPNPAIQSNRCSTVLALDVTPDGTQQLDGAEEIDVVCVDLDSIPGLITSGRITHSLVVAAFYLLDHWRRDHPDVL